MNTQEYLEARWAQTLETAQVAGGTTSYLPEILRMYSLPDRFYHTTEHLRSCFEVLDHMVAKLPGIGNVELALWYHDFVYDPKRSDNEEQSAMLAESRLLHITTQGVASLVAELIRATKHAHEPKTREAQVLLDVDLSILGSAPAVFDRYEENVRKEYAWVPDDAFREGRGAILQGFLARPRIYATPEFLNSSYEPQSQKNLLRSLKNLHHG